MAYMNGREAMQAHWTNGTRGMVQLYRKFRGLGLSALEAYTAAMCAVRTRHWHPSEAGGWARLYRGTPIRALMACQANLRPYPVLR